MAGVTAVTTSSIDSYSQAVLTQMGIHPINPTGLIGKATTMIATLYQDVVVLDLQYGVMFLVIGTLVWYIAWKFKAATVANWAKGVVWGTFVAEALVILLPQLYFGAMLLFSKI